jgi:hypothetical protein
MELIFSILFVALLAMFVEFMFEIIVSEDLPYILLRWMIIAVILFFGLTQMGHDILMNTPH